MKPAAGSSLPYNLLRRGFESLLQQRRELLGLLSHSLAQGGQILLQIVQTVGEMQTGEYGYPRGIGIGSLGGNGRHQFIHTLGQEFHFAWKSGLCNIERSQLRDPEHFAKWATLLAAVAARAERLKKLSREQPDLPATVEFTRDEIDAVILLRQPAGVTMGATATLGQVVRWIADLGGYTGKSSGGPPGVKVIGRALPEVAAAAAALAAVRSQPKSG